MTSLRRRKSRTLRSMLYGRSRDADLEDRLWDQMSPVGHEFGSPDFERLLEREHFNEDDVIDAILEVQRSVAPSEDA